MVIREQDRSLAVHMYRVAIGIVERNDAGAAHLAAAALDTPSPSTIRALLDAGRGRPWRASVVDALAEIGIAAIEDVLGDRLPVVVRPEGLPDSVAERLQQLADAGERSILDLTDSELDAVADSEIPPELRWDSSDLDDLDTGADK
jgi:hypothetical protein